MVLCQAVQAALHFVTHWFTCLEVPDLLSHGRLGVHVTTLDFWTEGRPLARRAATLATRAHMRSLGRHGCCRCGTPVRTTFRGRYPVRGRILERQAEP